MSGPFVLVPKVITDAMLSSSTIPEPAAGETLWNAATSYTVGQEVILASTHRVYENLIAGVSAVSPDVAVTQSPSRWLDKRLTLRWAAFDSYVTTQSTGTTSITYVLRPGLFNALVMYGLEGGSYSISIKDAPGGTVFFAQSGDLQEPPLDYYDYYFGVIKSLSKLIVKSILPQADPEVTITLTSGSGSPVKVGMIVLGDLRSIVSEDLVGGVQYNPQAKPTTTSLFINDGFGGTKIVRRTKATDMDFEALLDQADADSALYTLQDVLDVPAAWIASDEKGYAGLNVFGLASGAVKYAGPTHAYLTISVKGLF